MLVLKLTAIKVGGMVIVALESVSVKERRSPAAIYKYERFSVARSHSWAKMADFHPTSTRILALKWFFTQSTFIFRIADNEAAILNMARYRLLCPMPSLKSAVSRSRVGAQHEKRAVL
ncbi:MAG: hypothetical protein L6435_01940 [Anaerolineae bacterium]|nr:hypothetical protein [Anaerolineae bacterium]